MKNIHIDNPSTGSDRTIPNKSQSYICVLDIHLYRSHIYDAEID